MNPTSSAPSLKSAAAQIQEDSTLTALPQDVMPNIFERLPASNFFALACASKQVCRLVEPWLRSEAERKLGAFSPASLKNSIQNLAPLFRTGCHHISEVAWLKLLKAAADSGIDSDSIEMLLFAFATDDTKVSKLPTLPKFRTLSEFMRPYGTPGFWTVDMEPQTKNIDQMANIFILSVEEMIKAERSRGGLAEKTRQLSDRRGWKILTRIFSEFDSVRQKGLLLQVKPFKSDSAAIHLAFDELVAAHLTSLNRLPWFVFYPADFPYGEIENYSNMLADVYSLTPPQGGTSYLLSLCKDGLRHFRANIPWRRHSCGLAKLMFRVLAYEIRRNRTLGLADHADDLQSVIVKSFITPKELNHFTSELNSRMDRGMRLETAVDQWMDEMTNPGECVIS